MKIKFKNANILNKDFDVITSKDLIVEGNKIKSIVDTNSNDSEIYDRVIDCSGNFLIPGFKNAHSHNGMTFLRSYADDKPLQEWLFDYVLPKESLLTPDQSYYFTIAGVMENLASGITACAEMYKFNRFIADLYYKLGYRVAIVDSVTPYDKVIEPEELYHDLNNYKGDNKNLIRYQFGLHAEYTNNKETFKMMSDLIHKYKAPFFSHISETKREVDECKSRWGGLSPVEVNEEYGLYDFGGGGIHCVYFSDNDIDIFKKHKLTVITNPASNLKLASGIAPIKKYMNNGIRIAIGTDGPSSNNAINMFREMYLVSSLSKVVENNSVSISAKEVLEMSIKNAAYCMDMEDADSIEVGKLADIVLIDANKPNLIMNNNFVSNLVYSCDKTNVKLTMVDGKILYENGHYNLFEKEEYIYRKCDELWKDIYQ